MNAKNDVNVNAAALACLSEVVDQLKDEGLSKSGEYEGLLSYAVLNRLKINAKAMGLDLSDIGLAGFNPDVLLHKKSIAA